MLTHVVDVCCKNRKYTAWKNAGILKVTVGGACICVIAVNG